MPRCLGDACTDGWRLKPVNGRDGQMVSTDMAPEFHTCGNGNRCMLRHLVGGNSSGWAKLVDGNAVAHVAVLCLKIRSEQSWQGELQQSTARFNNRRTQRFNDIKQCHFDSI